MWGLKTTAVPEVMGLLGTIKRDMENYSNKIPSNINIHVLQKISLLSHFSGGSSPLSRNPLCHPKSMVWTRMFIEKINRNYICISYIIMMMTLF